MRSLSPALVLALAAAAFAPAAAAPQADAVRRDSARMNTALGAILVRAVDVASGRTLKPARLSTTFTDGQLNAWLQYDGKESVPPGLVSPKVTFVGPGRVTAVAVVDLDAVRKSKERGMLDPMNLLTGLVPVTLTGKLNGKGGQGTFDVESAQLGSWPLPRALLQELISYYSRSDDFPNGITLGQPFPLPAAVRDLTVARGSATIVQ